MRSDVALQAADAIAIVQQLIHGSGPRRFDSAGPFGPPTLDNVQLGADGTVICAGCEATFAISELAILLQAMLPVGQAVPGGLRYTIARGLLDVDAPPFDSLADLSRALARYESGDCAAMVKRLYERAALPVADRRRVDPAVAQLRRQLRDADARVYDQQLAIDALAAQSAPFARPSSSGKRRALLAGVAAGLVLMIAGEMMQFRHQAPTTSPPGAEVSAPPREATAAATSAPVAFAEPPADKASSAKPATRGTTSSRAPERRSRFSWLKRITIRADPL